MMAPDPKGKPTEVPTEGNKVNYVGQTENPNAGSIGGEVQKDRRGSEKK